MSFLSIIFYNLSLSMQNKVKVEDELLKQKIFFEVNNDVNT